MVDKVKKVMHEFKHGELHSGSKQGPLVQSRPQAIAIALSEQRAAGGGKPAPVKKKKHMFAKHPVSKRAFKV
jgi:hypothetical protein